MPKRMIEYAGVLYCWNSEKREIEIVTVRTDPVALDAVPAEAIKRLLDIKENEEGK